MEPIPTLLLLGSIVVALTGIIAFLKYLWPILWDWGSRLSLHYRRMEFRINMLFRRHSAPSAILNEALEIVKANDALCELLKTDRADLIGRQWPALTYREDFKEVADRLDYCIKHDEDLDLDYRIKAGNTHITVSVLTEHLNHGGRVREFNVTVRKLLR